MAPELNRAGTMLMRLSVVLLLTLAIGAAAAADKETPEKYWAETGISFKIVGTFLDQNCPKSPTTFIACVQSLNSVAGLLKPVAIFAAPAEAARAGSNIGTEIKGYGPFNLYDYNKPAADESLSLWWKNVEAGRQAQIQALTLAFNSGAAAKVKFSAILDELGSQVLKGDLAKSEGLISGQIMNVYLSSAVDPHAHLDSIQQDVDDEMSEDQSYAGVGVTLKSLAGKVIVENPMDGGPAFKAGIKARDIIDSVDGVPVGDQPLDQVAKTIKGPAGSTVALGIIRDGKPLSVNVVRGTIEVYNVETKMLKDSPWPIGYIKLRSFSEDTACEKIATSITNFQNEGAKALILDLRSNGGGLLEQAVCIGSLFVGKKVIVQVKDLRGQGDMKPYEGTRDQLTKLPMVTLIDAGSASASEILAGALQDYQRSWIAGDRSFGKATVQAPVRNLMGTMVIYSTIERFYQPSGRTNQIVGISPDFPIDPKPNATEDDNFALREADYFTNALPPVGPAWIEPRPAEVAAIESCVKKSDLAGRFYEQHQADAIAPDYRLISAESILNCAK